MSLKSQAVSAVSGAGPVHGVDKHSVAESLVINTADSYAPTTSADWTAIGSVPTTQDGALDTLASAAAAAETNAPTWATATYDFSVDGGAVGTVALDATVPDDAVVLYATVRILTGLTSGGAGTLKFVLPTDGDLTTTIAVGDSGLKDGVQDWTAANAVVTTAARTISATIATEALTAGKVQISVAYTKAP